MLIRIIAKHSDCVPAIAPQKEPVRDLCVKVHVRRSGKDAWTYLGRAFVSQELVGHSAQTSRVGEWWPDDTSHECSCGASFEVCSFQQDPYQLLGGQLSHKFLAAREHLPSFYAYQNSDIQAEKRGNFVILSCVEGSEVVSWSLNVGDPYTCSMRRYSC